MAWLFSKKNKHLPGEDLAYELSDDGSYYTVTGMGSCKKRNLIIPSEFSGKPVRVIGKEAFADTKIKSIIISEGIEEICYEAFFSCKNLKSITLPSTLKKINDWAFNGKVLKKVIIPSVRAWFDIEFTHDMSNPLITGAELYVGKKKLCNHPDAVKTINGVSYLAVPEGVSRISSFAFFECAWLKAISIPDSVKSIGQGAFYKCENLKKVTVASAKAWLTMKFEDCCSTPLCYDAELLVNDKPFFEASEACQIINGEPTFVVPDYITCLNNYVFANTPIKNVIIPPTVTELGDGVFYSCDNIEQVEIPDSVNKLGKKIFAYCKNLKKAVFPKSATVIPEDTFHLNYSLTDFVIPKGVTDIEESAFELCKNLKRIALPEGLKHIGDFAFKDCENLTDAALPRTVEEIHAYAFSSTSIEKVELSENIKLIGAHAFENCKKIESFTFPKHLYEIPEELLSGCVNLKELKLHDKLTKIGRAAFHQCILLKEIILDCPITKLEPFTFSGCEQLEKIVLPSTLESIGRTAFSCCAFKELAIPEGVTSIESSAFSGCQSLTTLILPAGIRYVNPNVFWAPLSPHLPEIRFNGTLAQFELVDFAAKSNEDNKYYNSVRVICTDGETKRCVP